MIGLALFGVAVAGERVIEAGLTAAQAAAQVVDDAHLPPGSVQATTFPTLVVGSAPRMLGAGVVIPCAGAGDGADPRASAGRAQERILAGDDAGASRELDAAIARLSCARDEMAIDEVARLHFLRGLAAIDVGDGPGAAAAFRQARSILPALQWDAATFGEDGREAFTAASPHAGVRFRVLPAPGEGRLIVDGLPFPAGPDGVDLPAAEHLIQVVGSSVTTVLVRIDGPATLLLPQAIGDGVTRWVTDPAWAPSLTTLIDTYGGPDVRWIALPEGTWHRDEEGWSKIAAHGALVLRAPAERRAAVGHALVPTGVVAAGAGLLAGAIGWYEADAASRWGDEPQAVAGSEADAYAAAVRRASTGRALVIVGGVVAGVGVVVTGSGVGLQLHGGAR